MGQGYSTNVLSNGTASADVSELPDITYEKTLGASRFMKSIKGKHEDGQVVVKIFVKPSQSLPLGGYRKEIQLERDIVASIPNAVSYSHVEETDRAAYLIRQHLYSSLYDRISTRPFLEEVEKRWIAFQLLCGLRDCHANGLHHGDIKSENVLVTTWSWAYLSDFAPFKPTYLPEDNPADFSFFFDTAGRRTCYLAPERFHGTGKYVEDKVTDAMDVFSLGCVIAELFLEGTALFNLSTIFKYRRGEFDPAQTYLTKIEDPEIRNLISHMINVDPKQRLSAEQYLADWRHKAFPDYFYSFLHQYAALITDPTSGRASMSSEYRNLGECDERIDRIYQDFDKISFFLGYEERNSLRDTELILSQARGRMTVRIDDGTLIFLNIVLASLRNSARARARVRACELILEFGIRVTDESKVDRCLPYLISLLKDPSVWVCVSAIKAITELMELVKIVSPVNVSIYSDYILPKLAIFTSNTIDGKKAYSSIVRSMYGSCLASLAENSHRFLDMGQAFRSDGALPAGDPEAENAIIETSYPSFDSAKNDLITHFEQQATALMIDEDATVKRSFLPSVTRLCVFFGRTTANDVLLSHLNTYLNDKDWMLKTAFLDTIVGVATFVGPISLEEYILPLMTQALADPEEFVVEKTLDSLAQMANLGLFQKGKTWEMIHMAVPFAVHPNAWIREASVSVVTGCLKWLSLTDVHSIVIPLISMCLRSNLGTFTQSTIIQNLKKPIPRNVLEASVNWAAKADRDSFWFHPKQQKGVSFGRLDSTNVLSKIIDNSPTSKLAVSISKDEQDDQWCSKLRNLGMKNEDEAKIILLKEYIFKLAQKRRNGVDYLSQLNDVIKLQSLGITPQTVFFDEQELGAEGSYEVRYLERRGSASTTSNFSTINQPSSKANSIAPTTKQDSNPRKFMRGNVRSGLPGQGKSAPALGTDATNAMGVVDSYVSDLHHASRRIPEHVVQARQPGYSYGGTDPNIQRLLNSLFMEQYPSDILEFGPVIVPLARRQPIRRNTGKPAGSWRPEGALVAQFGEHTAAVNRVVVAQDHAFFLTASDDGTVKVWDASRLEKNVGTRSRQTHKHAQGAEVKCICFVENTHCFVSAANDGSIHVVKVDFGLVAGVLKIGKLKMLREYQLPEGEHAVWIEHYKSEPASILMVATNKSRIAALDLRTMTEMYSLQNPTHHGALTCFCLDKRGRAWLLLGTTHGILDLWDLRFRLRLKAWGLPGSTSIHRLVIHPVKGRGKWVCVAGGSGHGEVTVWDIEKTQCREVYRGGGETETGMGYDPWKVDEEKSEDVLNRFARQAVDPTTPSIVDRGVRTIALGVDSTEDGRDTKSAYGFLISSGQDRKMKYWDLGKIESSFVFSGLEVDEPKPTYSASHPSVTLTMNTERPGNWNDVPKGADGKRQKNAARQSRSTVISQHQQQLLKSHLDSILDIALLEKPYGMIVSVDRAGSILIHQ